MSTLRGSSEDESSHPLTSRQVSLRSRWHYRQSNSRAVSDDDYTSQTSQVDSKRGSNTHRNSLILYILSQLTERESVSLVLETSDLASRSIDTPIDEFSLESIIQRRTIVPFVIALPD